MQIVLVRHAKALDKDIAKKKKISDPQRALTTEGKNEFARHVQKNKSIFKDVDLFVTSPYVRAKETLDIILEKIGKAKAKKIILKKIIPDADPADLLNWLNTRPESKIVLVSHEPFLSHFLNLVLPFEDRPQKIRKGDIIQIERIQSWQKRD